MTGNYGNFCRISTVNRFIKLSDMNRIHVLVENHECTNEDLLTRLIHEDIPLVTRLQGEAEVAQLSYGVLPIVALPASAPPSKPAQLVLPISPFSS